MYIISFLLAAWLLTLFDIDETITKGINEVFNKEFTASVYWLIFFGIGLIMDLSYGIDKVFGWSL